MKIPATELRDRLRAALKLLDDPHPGLPTWIDMLHARMLDVRDAAVRWYEHGIGDVDTLGAAPTPPAPPVEQDWTVANGRANSSPEFVRLAKVVGQLIRGDASTLLAGRVGDTGRLVIAQLAHKYGMAPRGAVYPHKLFRRCACCNATVSMTVPDDALLGCNTTDRKHVWER